MQERDGVARYLSVTWIEIRQFTDTISKRMSSKGSDKFFSQNLISKNSVVAHSRAVKNSRQLARSTKSVQLTCDLDLSEYCCTRNKICPNHTYDQLWLCHFCFAIQSKYKSQGTKEDQKQQNTGICPTNVLRRSIPRCRRTSVRQSQTNPSVFGCVWQQKVEGSSKDVLRYTEAELHLRKTWGKFENPPRLPKVKLPGTYTKARI